MAEQKKVILSGLRPTGRHEVTTADGTTVTEMSGPDLYTQEIEEFARCVLGDGTPSATAVDGLVACLKHSNGGIRYWGAKGLRHSRRHWDKHPGAAQQAVEAIVDATGRETNEIIVRKIFADSWSPSRMEDAFYAAFSTLTAVGDYTLMDVPRFLTNSDFRLGRPKTRHPRPTVQAPSCRAQERQAYPRRR